MKSPAPTPTRSDCALCLRARRVVRSHIVPEFLYQNLYDPRHRARRIDVLSGERGFVQKGLREPMLCLECEGLLNDRYEKPFATTWRESGLRPKTVPPHRVHAVHGLDYSTVKLFLLSVLWRASESALPEFRFIDLAGHSDVIRCALLAGTLPLGDPYPIVGAYVVGKAGEVLACVVPPVPYRIDGHRAFCFILDGCEWVFFMSRHRAELTEGWGLLPDGSCKLGSLPLAKSWSVRGVRIGRRR